MAESEAADTVEAILLDRDVLDAILLKLTGVEALRAAATCKAFQNALAPTEAIWSEYYAIEFGEHGFTFATPLAWSRRYRIAYQRLHLCAARWDRSHTHGDGPGARQGAASCAITAFGGGFAVYGGWTDDHGISRDLHVLCRRESAAADGAGDASAIGDWQWSAVPLRQRYNGPSRASYGPSLTAVPAAGEEQAESLRLLVLGGVTSGGYRGAMGSVHTIALSRGAPPTGGADGADSGDAVLAGEWTEESSVDGRPRAYHTATYVPTDGTVDASNGGKMFVFGGHNDVTDGGCIAHLETYDVSARTWDPLPLGGAGQGQPTPPEPCARLGHSAVLLGGSLFISGGCTDDSNMKPGEGGDELSDVWVLDLRVASADLVWSCVSPLGAAPSGALQRCHGASALGRSIIYFGGGRSSSLTNAISIFDTEAKTWRDGPTSLIGRPPTTRQNAQCAMIPGTGLLAVFGGWKLGPMGQDRNLGDTILLDLDAATSGSAEEAVRAATSHARPCNVLRASAAPLLRPSAPHLRRICAASAPLRTRLALAAWPRQVSLQT
jgi:hypothetical protein